MIFGLLLFLQTGCDLVDQIRETVLAEEPSEKSPKIKKPFEQQKKHLDLEKNKEKERKPPYSYFEVNGLLKEITLIRMDQTLGSNTEAQPYRVELIIEYSSISPRPEKIPDELKVEGSDQFIRVSLNDRPSFDKDSVRANGSLTPVGELEPLSRIKASSWKNYTVDEMVSVGVIYSGEKNL